MARYTAEQIYAFAREAGFSPDQAATMTAIALAESRGDSTARDPRGGRGLWRIDVRAHADLAGDDLFDPLSNARAAFAVSRGGVDLSPWATARGGPSARYLRFRAEAEAAGVAHGDGPGLGMWAGADGHGEGGSAAAASSEAAAVVAEIRIGQAEGIPLEIPARVDPLAGAGAQAPAPSDRVTPTELTRRFLETAAAQTGDRYVFGHEVDLSDPDPSTFDCSELVQWATHQVGVEIPDGAVNQYAHLRDGGHLIPVEQAIDTPGALLFSFSSDPDAARPRAGHVAISLGDGKTIEAMGPRYGVGSWKAGRRFQYAAVIPGLSGAAAAPPEVEAGDAPACAAPPPAEGDHLDEGLLDPDAAGPGGAR